MQTQLFGKHVHMSALFFPTEISQSTRALGWKYDLRLKMAAHKIVM